jgi:EAL domain-containing protein (putative c-di-GMP-specific phosphodiesterase class I)
LEIEITESRLMESMDTNVRILDELKKLGIKISLDDFGTGYSSLNYLKALPIDTVKIDKSFIDNICTNSNENAITEGIIFLAHRIGLNVTAEGVELKEQYELLNDEECDKIQGYIFSRPVLAEKVEEMILKGKYDLG